MADAHAQMEDLDQGENQDYNIQDEVCRNGAEEELVAIDVAHLIRDGVIPQRLNGNAAKGKHEGSQDNPYAHYDKKADDGDADR